MATMWFNVPDEVQARFEELFQGRNKNAIVTGLLAHAVEAEERRQRLSQSLLERLRGVGDADVPSADDWIGGPWRGR
jgi:ubiquinone biosynthesis protein COQ9